MWNKMEHSLLIGNGLNMGEPNENISWVDLLNKLCTCTDYKRKYGVQNDRQYKDTLPSKNNTLYSENNTLYYEELFLNQSPNETEKNIKEKIVELLKDIKITDNINKLPKLNIKNYMTTNYDLSLEHAFKRKIYRNIGNNEKIYSIRRGYQVDDIEKTIWHIHGIIDNPKSIILGYDHYCGYISKIDQYVKGKYINKDTKKTIMSMKAKIDEYHKIFPMKDSVEKNKMMINFYNANVRSWIDLLFFSNVHIIGFGLDYNEIDIWWLLNKRARMIKEKILIENKIIFYAELNDKFKKHYLEAFGVIVEEKNSNEKWTDFYDRILKKIKEDSV